MVTYYYLTVFILISLHIVTFIVFKFIVGSYSSAEQVFEHCKVLFFDDTDVAGKIMSTCKPIEAFRFGRKIAEFDSTK